MSEVLDAEVIEETIEFIPDDGGLPMTCRLGWCQDAFDLQLTCAEEDLLHDQCPGTIWPMQWPDPARKGSTYTLPGRRCSCACHARALPSTQSRTNEKEQDRG